MANVLTVVWFVIAYVVAQTALVIWAALVFPQRAEVARRRIEQHTYRCFFLGALVFAVTIFFVSLLLKDGRGAPLQLLGWMMAGPGLAASILGNAGFATLMAERLRTRAEIRGRFVPLLGGALLTVLPALVPIAGWFLYAPVVALISFGAGATALLSGGKKAASPSPAWVPLAGASQPMPVPAPMVPEASPGSAFETAS